MTRRLHPLPFLALVCLFYSGMSSHAQSSPFRISGIVINSVNGNPVPRCHLEASLTGRTRGPRGVPAGNGADCDASGRFALPLPSSGSWHLSASAPGYVSQAYDAHGLFSSAVVLTAAAPTFDLQFRLPPQGRISGTVLDEAGEAVRSANVELLIQSLPSPGNSADQLFQRRGFAQTDDRGVYEFAGLPPASYRIALQARPWYASSAQSRQLGRAPAAASSPADPSLDVTYPYVWYPGVDDPNQAETVSLESGAETHADFRLSPVPALHLQIIPPPSEQQNGPRPIPSFPIVERIDDGGGRGISSTSSSTGPQGMMDIGGLSPGTYRVTLQGPGQTGRSTIVQIQEGSSRTVDLSEPTSNLANINIRFDGGEDYDRPMMVELIDAATGRHYSPFGGGRPLGLRQSASGTLTSSRFGYAASSDRENTLQVPPGRYEVTLQTRSDAFLTGVSAQGATVNGRMITVHSGEATLTLHTRSGRITVTGIATMGSKPCSGAAILLVPAGLDDPGSFTALTRDQSNTDGSFELEDVVPGQYILVAVDHGWHINWKDPETLLNYLTHGIPIDLGRQTKVNQNIEAQTP